MWGWTSLASGCSTMTLDPSPQSPLSSRCKHLLILAQTCLPSIGDRIQVAAFLWQAPVCYLQHAAVSWADAVLTSVCHDQAVYGVLKEAEHRSTFYIPYW